MINISAFGIDVKKNNIHFKKKLNLIYTMETMTQEQNNIYVVLNNIDNVIDDQDLVIIKCPILNKFKTTNDDDIFNIRLINDVFQIKWNTNDKYTYVFKYRLSVNPNNVLTETIANTNFIAFFNYTDAIKYVVNMERKSLSILQNKINRKLNNLFNIINDDNIAIPTNEYDNLISKNKENSSN